MDYVFLRSSIIAVYLPTSHVRKDGYAGPWLKKIIPIVQVHIMRLVQEKLVKNVMWKIHVCLEVDVIKTDVVNIAC
jgi:hypothetical protein